MLTSISSFLFIMCSSVFGMPISGTHTVVGALIGSGIAASGSGTINWDKLTIIVGSWFVAPAVAAVLSLIIMTIVAASTLNSKVRLATRLIWVTIISAFSSSIIAVMVISITKDNKDPFTSWHWTILGVAAVIGIVTSRLILLGLTLGQENLTWAHVMSAVLQIWDATRFEQMFKRKLNYEEGEDAEEKEPMVTSALNELQDEEVRRKVASLTLEQNREEMEKKLVSELYRYLMLVAAMMVCLGHGSNDVSNSISPLLVVFVAQGSDVQNAYLIGSLGIALGLLILGK